MLKFDQNKNTSKKSISKETLKLQTQPLVDNECEEQNEQNVRSRTNSRSGSESGSDVTEGPDELSSEYDDLCDEQIAKEADLADDLVTKVPESDRMALSEINTVENKNIEIGIDSAQTNLELGCDGDSEQVSIEASDDVLVGPDNQSDTAREDHVSQSDLPSEEKTPSSELIVTENPMAAVSADCYDVYTHETFEDDSEIESSQIVPEPIAAVIVDDQVTAAEILVEAPEKLPVAVNPAVKDNGNNQAKNESEAEPEQTSDELADETVGTDLNQGGEDENQTEARNEPDGKSIERQVQENDAEIIKNDEFDSVKHIELLNDNVNENESQETENEDSHADSNRESTDHPDTVSADYETIAEANSTTQATDKQASEADNYEEPSDDEKEEIAAVILEPDYVAGGCASREIGVADAEADFVVFGNTKTISEQDSSQHQELTIEPVNETGGTQNYQPLETADIPSEPIIDTVAVTTDVQDDGGAESCDGNEQPNGISVEQNTIEQALEEIVIATEGADDTEDQQEEVGEEASVNDDAHSVHENNIDQNQGETIEHVNDINAEATENDISSAALDESLVGGLDHSRAYDPTIVSDASEVDDLTDDAAEGNDF